MLSFQGGIFPFFLEFRILKSSNFEIGVSRAPIFSLLATSLLVFKNWRLCVIRLLRWRLLLKAAAAAVPVLQ